MKSLIALLLLTAISHASRPVTYRLEHINLPVGKANQLMRAAMIDEEDGWKILEPLIADGTATIFSGAMISTYGDNHTQISSAVEWIYPTEFDPPELPNTIKLDGVVTRDRMPMSTTTPTAFETRDVGTSLEIAGIEINADPFSSDPKLFSSSSLQMSSDLTEQIGNHVIGEREAREWIANFHHQRIRQQLKVVSNQWTLLATTATPDPKIVTTTWLRRVPAVTAIEIPTTDLKETNIRYVAEWFTIDDDHASAWLDTVTADPDNSKAYAALKELVGKGHASSISTRLFLSSSGTPVRNDAGDEMIFATEVDPPELPNKVTGNVINGADIATEATPTAFETRNLGATIILETNAYEESELMTCLIQAELSDHDFDHACGEGKSLIHMPMIRHSKIKTDAYLLNGKPHFVGAITRPVRVYPAPEVKRSDDPSDPPKYQIGGTPRTVLFLTATIDQS